MDGDEILGMDDDAFLKNLGDISTQANAAGTDTTPEVTTTEAVVEPVVDTAPEVDTTPATAEAADPEDGDEPKADTVVPGSETTAAPAAKVDEAPAGGDKEITPPVTTADTPPDYKAVYDQVMAPFQANGKSIQVKTPEEALQLMKQGANYTQKMQSIAPHRKVLMMLENNDLLSEEKLSRLIDLDKKNPDAIRALIKEAGIDPLDIDVSAESTYVPGDHKVSDAAVVFQTTLEEVTSTPAGKETVRTITDSWDAGSKAEIWKDPSILATIHQQREQGVYTRVADEIERQRILGAIPANVSFLDAYRAVGIQMTNSGAFADLQAAQTAPQTAPIQLPLATRVAAPKPVVANAAKVGAAAPTRTAPRRAQPLVNPLALSDDEFMKQFANKY